MDVSDIFYFFCLGEGKGARGARKGFGGVSILLKIPGGGGSPRREEGGGRGTWRVSAGSLGGAKYFFSGLKCPPSSIF